MTSNWKTNGCTDLLDIQAQHTLYIVSCWIRTKFTVIKIEMFFLVTCQRNPFKNEETRMISTFLPLLVYRGFSDAQWQLTPLLKVWSGGNLNFYCIQVENEDTKCLQHFSNSFQTLKGAYSAVRGQIEPKF